MSPPHPQRVPIVSEDCSASEPSLQGRTSKVTPGVLIIPTFSRSQATPKTNGEGGVFGSIVPENSTNNIKMGTGLHRIGGGNTGGGVLLHEGPAAIGQDLKPRNPD